MALTDNLVSYWKLNESSGNAVDSVGSNTGTSTGVTYSTGKINNGAVYNGSAFHTLTPSLLPTGNSSFTHSIWVKITTAPGIGVPYAFIYNGNTTSKASVSLQYVNSGGTTILYGGAFAANISYNTTLTTDTWYHVAQTYDGTTNLLYLNGTQVASGALSSLTVGTNNAYLGQDIGGSSKLIGMLDETGVWSRALSPNEIQSLYRAGQGNQFPFGSAFNNTLTPSVRSASGVSVTERTM